MAPRDEPFLELELTGWRPDPRAQPVVGGRQQGQPEPDGAGDPGGHRRQRLAATERLRPDEMEPEVAVAELEPRLATEAFDRVASVPGFARAAPAALLVPEAGECVEQRVEVRGDVETVDLEVVADVCDHRHVARVHNLDQRLHEARAAHAACQDGELHRAPERRLSTAARVLAPSRSSSRSRSSTVSTSSVRFGISTSRDGARARNRSALPGP